jgi:hypothetical protein
MRFGLTIILTAAALAVPAAAQAQEWLSFREAGGQIRGWGRQTADANGDTITRQKVSLCIRSSATRVRCWYEEDGYDIDGYDYECWGTVRVIEYATHYNIAPIRHGRFRLRCF